MLEVKDLHKYYGSFHAVRGITMDVDKGEIVGFLGPNGAGKTTVMKIVTGYMAMSAGDVRVDGHDVVTDSLAVREVIGYLPENAPIYDDMTVIEYLNHVCDMRGLRGDRRRRRIDHVIDVCNLGPKRRSLCSTLSKGYRQRVGLAQAIIHEPKLVILDEPTVGLDPNQIIEIRRVIREIGSENTVILSSHILSEVEATCSRVIIVCDGEIVAQGSPTELERRYAAQNCWNVTFTGIDDAIAVAEALGSLSIVSSVPDAQGSENAVTAVVEATGSDLVTSVFELAAERRWSLREVGPRRETLEDVFRSLTSGAHRFEVSDSEEEFEDVGSTGITMAAPAAPSAPAEEANEPKEND